VLRDRPQKANGGVPRLELLRPAIELIIVRTVKQNPPGQYFEILVGHDVADEDPVRSIASLDLIKRQNLFPMFVPEPDFILDRV
jgi:hypothetical protein